MADDMTDDPDCKFEGNDCHYILNLPPEILTKIFSERCLSYTDLGRIAQTCSKLNEVVQDDDVWRQKHVDRWPCVYNYLRKSSSDIFWRDECKRGAKMQRTALDSLNQVWPTAYKNNSLCPSAFRQFMELSRQDELYYLYMKQALQDLIQDVGLSNLTVRCYARHIACLMHQEYLKRKWQEFKELPKEKQLLENGAIFVAQWFQPFTDIADDVWWYVPGKRLDKLAEEVLQVLQLLHPEHPIFNVPLKTRQMWRYQTLDNNLWAPRQCYQLLGAMEEVICVQQGFVGCGGRYHEAENCFINKVLDHHQGVPITMNILIESVARRVGIHTEPKFERYFLLQWRENFMTSDLASSDYYIDIYNKAGFLTKEMDNHIRCPFTASPPAHPRSITPIKVVARLAADVEISQRLNMLYEGSGSCALELVHLLEPADLNKLMQLGQFYKENNMSTASLVDTIQQMITNGLSPEEHFHAAYYMEALKYEPQPLKPKMRTVQYRIKVNYAVGMVMRHKKYHYTCVITGWDPNCLASFQWKQEMGVFTLQFRDDQPFYHVLVQDSSRRYAAQENLEPFVFDNEVLHVHDIGLYFSAFQKGCYKPHHLLEEEYPNDGVIRKKYYRPDVE